MVRFWNGDLPRVWLFHGFPSLAERVRSPAATVVRPPDGVRGGGVEGLGANEVKADLPPVRAHQR